MIRLTVLYNLQPFVNEDEFLEWRLGEHQRNNMGMPGVIRSDFARIDSGYPAEVSPPYRFMTTAEWPDMQTFQQVFYDPIYQESLQENIKMLKDPLFLVSEILVQESNDRTSQNDSRSPIRAWG